MESKRTMGFCVLSFMAIGLLAMSVSASETNDISCRQALKNMVPCNDYLKGSGPDQPPSACCNNAYSLLKQATSTQQTQRDICNCLKDAAIKMGVNLDRAKKLAPSCKIPLPFPIDPKIDCKSISLEPLMVERFN